MCIIEQIGWKNEKKIIINSLKDSISELCYDTENSCTWKGFIFDYVEKNFLNLSNHINGKE